MKQLMIKTKMEEQNPRESLEESVLREEESGWKLYYSEEGYPYYYNEVTGDSRWAEYQDDNAGEYQYNESYQQGNYDRSYEYHYNEEPRYQDPHSVWKQNADSIDEEAIKMKTKANYKHSDRGYGEDDEEDEEHGFDGDEDSDDESGDSEDEEELDPKFKEYLRTPEGMAAVLVRIKMILSSPNLILFLLYIQYEQERIERQVGLHQERQTVQRDAEYVQGLLLAKKSDDHGRENQQGRNRIINKPMNVFESIRDGFNVYLKGLIDPSEQAAKVEKKLKKRTEKADVASKSQSIPSKGRRIKIENSQILTNSTTAIVEEDEETGNAEQSVSKSSSSSDLVSLSSNDSDVAVVSVA